jgi:hypothetical protein
MQELTQKHSITPISKRQSSSPLNPRADPPMNPQSRMVLLSVGKTVSVSFSLCASVHPLRKRLHRASQAFIRRVCIAC